MENKEKRGRSIQKKKKMIVGGKSFIRVMWTQNVPKDDVNNFWLMSKLNNEQI